MIMFDLYVITEQNRLFRAGLHVVFHFCCASLLLISFHVSAQSPRAIHFETLSINDGLSQGFVSSMTQDKKGFMWFGTSDGLNKYDGYTFTVYHHNPDDTSSLASDDITGVFEDSKERLWILTRHNGLELFDRENNVFIHFRHEGVNSLRSDNLSAITEDKTGALWIRSNEGIDRLEVPEPSIKGNSPDLILDENQAIFTHINISPMTAGLSARFNTPYIFVDSDGHILLSTYNSIWQIDFNGKGHTYTLSQRFKFEHVNTEHLPTMVEDEATKTLYINNGTIFRIRNQRFDLPEIIYTGSIGLAAWAMDHNERLWVADRNKVLRISLSSGDVSHISPSDLSFNELLRSTTSIFVDRTGVLWIATGGYGILKYNAQTEQFHHIMQQSRIYQIVEYKPGELLTNSMVSVNLRKDTPVVIKKMTGAENIKKFFPKLGIISFTQDTSGNVYFGSHGRLTKYNPESKAIRSIPMPETEQASQPTPVYADRMNNIWMGYNKNLIQYNTSTEKFTLFNYPLPPMNYEYDFLQCFYEDNNNLWLGSVEGLFRFNTIDKSIQHYENKQSDSNSLSNNYIYCIYSDPNKSPAELWIGTKGGGLNRFDKITGKFKRFGTKQGLPNNVVYGILPGEDGKLWLSTNNGLCEFDTRSYVSRNFDVSDGLQSNEFNRYAFTKTTDGFLVFGGMYGMNYFKPRDIKPLAQPTVVFTDFRLFNKKVNLKNEGSPLKKDISFIDQIQLEYKQNVITFQFAAMDYRKSSSAQYRYRMEGFDKNWIYSGSVREATYTNLDPGTYRFVVQATFEPGSWGQEQTDFEVIVIAPWYLTWWFYVILAMITASLTYAIYRYRLNQLTKLEMLRNRIARDLHDEVGSSISTIAIYSKIVHEHLGNATFNNDTLMKKITDNAHEIMESMNDIVWNINSKNDAFEHIISRMRENAHQLLEAKSYKLNFNFDENLYKMKLTMEKRRDFYLVYKEAINNIAKYANGTEVWITLVVHNNIISMTIKDNGIGFDMNAVKKSSNGLFNMNFRTTALGGKITITSAPSEGTEITMSF